jgi:hypothetical protein
MPVVTVSRAVLLVGVIMLILAAFGVSAGPADLGRLGAAICFASFLVP